MRVILFSFFLMVAFSLFAQTIYIGNTGDFLTLEDAEQIIKPGDTLIVMDGVYNDGAQFLTLKGTESEPIIIQAENLHQAIFRGGSEAIHLINSSHVQIHGLVFEQQTGNGINIDDGGDYSTPTHHISIFNCIFRDMAASGNNDLLKLSGLDNFLVKGNQFINGGVGGSGVDMVGCHHGVIEDNFFDNAGVTGIQAKGGTQFILIQRNILKDMSQRALNLGGSTGLAFFRPPLGDNIVNAFEAADLEVYSNIFIRSLAPIAYVGSVRVKVINNTIFNPEKWVIRILQETTEPGFLTCADNEFVNNIVYQNNDLTEVNIGPNTSPESFKFSNNLWFNSSSGDWEPDLPALDVHQIISDPLFIEFIDNNFQIPENSPAVQNGLTVDAPITDFNQNTFYNPPSIGAIEGFTTSTTAYNIHNDNAIIVEPNPSSKRIKISGNFSDASIFIISVNGSLIKSYKGASSPMDIEINLLDDGLYFLKMLDSSNNELTTKTFIKI